MAKRRDNATDIAMGAIKDYILSHGLRPGSPMPTESELVEQVNVSRSAVREAIRTLSALDIVEVRHGTGTFVGPMSLRPLVEGLAFRGVLMPGDDLHALQEILDLRVALDLAAADEVVAAFAGTTNPELHRLVSEMEAKCSLRQSFGDEDREFHTRILLRTGKVLLGQLVVAFWDVHAVLAPRLGVPTPHDLNETAAAHGDMLKAAENGDAAAYRKAIDRHYGPLRRVLEAASNAH